MNEKTEVNNEVQIKLQEVELPKMDLTKYVGKKERIGQVSTHKGEYGYYLKLTTTTVDVVKFGNEEKTLVASRIFSLHADKDANIGWGKGTQLDEYLKLKGVTHPDALLGKEVTIQLNVKNGTSFLTFI